MSGSDSSHEQFRSGFNFVWAVIGSVSVRVKILGIVLGVIVLLGIVVTIQINTIIQAVAPANEASFFAFTLPNQLQPTAAQITLQIFALTVLMIAVGFAAAFFLTWILTRPLLDLVRAAHAVEQGDFSVRVLRWADDEIGDLATAFNAMTEALQKAEQERQERERLREGYISGVITAQENERQRIARELHDSISQSLTALLLGVQHLKQSHALDDMRDHVDELREIIAQTLEETRTIARQLRPSLLDDLGLISALTHTIDDFRKRYDIPVDLVVNGLDSRLPPQLETTIYRIAQEGLTNVARYAKASAVSIIITQRNDTLRIIIEDNGIGFDVENVTRNSKSLGLQGIRERAGLFNGTLEIESHPGSGTSLFVEIPYTPPVPEFSEGQPHE
jgi:signal transduction histidine kinase